MKQKILEILGYAFDPEIAELKAEEIIKLFDNSIPSHVAKKILKSRDALINNEYEEAYHQLYAIAHPNFDVYSNDVWKELEKLANKTSLK